jgi:hypothetical protein
MVKEFLGINEEKPENGYQNNIKNYFKKKRNHSMNLESKKFLCNTMEDFEKEWSDYYKQVVQGEKSVPNFEWNQLEKTFLNNLSNFLSNSNVQFTFSHWVSLESAVNNFIILNSEFSQEELSQVHKTILDNLTSSKNENQALIYRLRKRRTEQC